MEHTGPDALTDTWTVAKTHWSQEMSTFHGYETPGAPGARIDWILTRGPWETLGAGIVPTVSPGGQYPSDHFPIVAEVMLKG